MAGLVAEGGLIEDLHRIIRAALGEGAVDSRFIGQEDLRAGALDDGGGLAAHAGGKRCLRAGCRCCGLLGFHRHDVGRIRLAAACKRHKEGGGNEMTEKL